MGGRFQFDRERELAAPDGRQQFFASLDRAFRPAMLLRLETIHVDRQFCRRHDIGQKNKFPAGELGTITQVEIFGKRVMLPAARFFDTRTPPETGRAVEIKETPATAARGLLEQKMSIEEHRL